MKRSQEILSRMVSVNTLGSRAYLVGASKHCGQVFYHLTFNRDLAYSFASRHTAREARQLLNEKSLAGRVIWVSKAPAPVA